MSEVQAVSHVSPQKYPWWSAGFKFCGGLREADSPANRSGCPSSDALPSCRRAGVRSFWTATLAFNSLGFKRQRAWEEGNWKGRNLTRATKDTSKIPGWRDASSSWNFQSCWKDSILGPVFIWWILVPGLKFEAVAQSIYTIVGSFRSVDEMGGYVVSQSILW